ncbi:alkaline phosphatase family protein [Bacillus sp. JCM 19034]|uniref:alkaline phosphatase family protein n=1 Tax=Bacillus sp. JCM 19034 TaxID=1481928 RepID=UPI0007829B64|nr:alkaline phosphatase family protein [Bacillus sp. JCM 19034]
MKKILVILVILLLVSCQKEQQGQTSFSIQQTANNEKKVIVIMIDSMTEKILEKGFREGRLPALSYLAEQGTIYHDVVAPFPSMSVTIESSLLTGDSPHEHQIPGLTWYDAHSDTLISYGDSIPSVWKLGRKTTLMNALINLNNEHLNKQSETIYESIKRNELSSGSVNMLVYRGNKEHKLVVPTFVKTLFHLDSSEYQTKGPDVLTFGKAIQPKTNSSLPDSALENLGLNDHYSSEVIAHLIKENQQPHFLMAYFPDFDKLAHHHGPYAIDYFASVDQHIQRILNAYDSWEKALEDTTFVILGDHGQSALVDDRERAGIDVETIVNPYTIAPLYDSPSLGDVVVANNHRMAYIYAINERLTFYELGEMFLSDERIDHVAWLDGDDLVIQQQGKEGYLRVSNGGPWIDKYDQKWSFEGNLDIAHITIDDNGVIKYEDYPDIFHQLESALNSHTESLIVTAKPGYTLQSEGAPVHAGGGEHGGLHKDDTITSMIISNRNKLPEKRRMSDLYEYFHTLFD